MSKIAAILWLVFLASPAAAFQEVGPLGAGEVLQLVSLGGNPPVLVARTPGGLFKSDDGGAHFRTLQLPRYSHPSELVQDPRDPLVLYLTGDGLLRSRDGGEHFEWVGGSRFGSFGLAVDPRDSQNLYLVLNCVTMRSTDSGESWSTIGDHECSWIRRVTMDWQGRLWAVTMDGRLSFLDGSEWVDTSSVAVRFSTVAAHPSGAVWAGTCGAGIQEWIDKAGWSRLGDRFADQTCVVAMTFDRDDASHVWALLDGDGVWETHDRGESWSPLGSDLYRRKLFSLLADKASGAVWVGTGEAGLWRFDGRGQGAQGIAVDPQPVDVRLAVFDPFDSGRLYLASAWGCWRSDRRWRWQELRGRRPEAIPGRTRDGNYYRWYPGCATEASLTSLAADFFVPGRIYAGWDDGAVGRSDDGGESWRIMFRLPTFEVPQGLTADPHVPHRVILTTWHNGVWVSRDGGASFLPSPGSPNTITPAVADPFRPGVFFLASGYGALFGSTTGGLTWESKSPDYPEVEVVAMDPLRPGWLYAGLYRGGAMRSQNGGLTWESLADSLPGNIPPVSVLSLVALPTSPPTLVATVDPWFYGMYRYREGEDLWRRLSPLNAHLIADPADQEGILAIGGLGSRNSLWQGRTDEATGSVRRHLRHEDHLRGNRPAHE